MFVLQSQPIIVCIIAVTHSVLCLLLSVDKFYIHFGGSLEHLINDYDYDYDHDCMYYILPCFEYCTIA